MLVIHGRDFERTMRGWNFFDCPRCKCIQLFLIEIHVKKSHLYYIDLPDVVLGDVITCDFCDTNFQTPQEQEVKFNRKWSRSDLIEYIEKSNFFEAIGVIKKAGWRNEELVGALVAMQEKASTVIKNTNKGCFIGAILGTILTLCFGNLAYKFGFRLGQIDEFGIGFISLLIGGFLGGVIGAIFSHFSQVRLIRQKALSDFLGKHKVPLKVLMQAASTTNINLKKILTVCEDELKKHPLNFK